jgi:transaldolase
MVGDDVHVTINWSTAQELIDVDGPVVDRMSESTSQETVRELSERFPDFRKAYDEQGLSVDEFADYGPGQLFRNAFLKGWYLLLAEIVSRRHASAI